MKSFFDSPIAKKEINNLYQDKLDALDINYELIKVETSFGDTNIIQTGPKNKPSLVLLHGSNACAPIALEALIDLADHFNIYAIDVVGQPNLSEEQRPSMQNQSYGQWMFEILARLNVSAAILVGIAFGGFISWKLLAFDARHISKAFLITPAGIAYGNPIKLIRKVLLPIKYFKQFQEIKYVQQILEELFSEPDEFVTSYLSKILLHYDLDFSPVPLITKEEAQRITKEVHIITVDQDILFPGLKILQRAEKIFNTLGHLILLENSKHVLGENSNQIIVDLIKKASPKHISIDKKYLKTGELSNKSLTQTSSASKNKERLL